MIIGVTSLMWPVGAFAQQVSGRERFEFLDVSIPSSFALKPPERVEGFECIVRGGSVERIYVPYEWDLAIDNSSEAIGQKSEVKASYDVGAAELSSAQYFNKFVTVARLRELGPLEVTVELTIDTMKNGERKVKFDQKQLVLTPASDAHHAF
jgi:hypothetical protein